jgi:hypothetical protein
MPPLGAPGRAGPQRDRVTAGRADDFCHAFSVPGLGPLRSRCLSLAPARLPADLPG